ncbi:MAG: GyrI-like domain-containing protein [Ignavibacteriaceae bacterium]
MINIKPEILFRNEEHYVSIKNKLKREDVPSELPPLIPELFNWLQKKVIKPEGTPFFSYKKMNREQIEIDVGNPASSQFEGDDRILPGVFPAGKYTVVKYTTPYNRLFEVHTVVHISKSRILSDRSYGRTRSKNGKLLF